MNFCFILKHKITLFYLLSFFFIRFITCCYSLSLIVIFCHRCHSLLLVVIHSTRCHSLSFVVARCTTSCHSLSHSLSLIVPLIVQSLCHSLAFIVTRCHSLSPVVPLVVTRFTTRLSLYKRSQSEQAVSFSKINIMDH